MKKYLFLLIGFLLVVFRTLNSQFANQIWPSTIHAFILLIPLSILLIMFLISDYAKPKLHK